PRRATATQRLLVDQLREGPAAHLIIAPVSGGGPATRAEVSRQISARLRTDPAFLAIENGAEAELQREREFLFAHRYLLSSRVTPERFSASGLHEAIGEALDLLASAAGAVGEAPFPAEPTPGNARNHRSPRCEPRPAHRCG